MEKKQTPLFTMLRAIIFARNTDRCLDQTTIDNMAKSLESFTMFAIDKFVKGQKEHGGKITDRNLPEELAYEQIDSFWYGPFGAMSWKKEDSNNHPHHD